MEEALEKIQAVYHILVNKKIEGLSIPIELLTQAITQLSQEIKKEK